VGPNVQTIVKGWGYVAEGNWDALMADYHQNVRFIMPGQNDVLEGASSLRSALDKFGEIVPPGFEVLGMEHFESEAQNVVTALSWKCSKIPEGSNSSILFKMRDGKIEEERWFVDTEQWKAAF
jgi:hypothetical protein